MFWEWQDCLNKLCVSKNGKNLYLFLKKKLIKSDNWLIWDRGQELFSLIFYLSNCPFLSGVVVLKPASRCASCGWFVQLANTLKNAPSKGGEKK